MKIRHTLCCAAMLAFCVVFGNLGWAQDVDVLSGTTLASGLDMGVDTSGGRTDWLTQQNGVFRMQYPTGQDWGAVFVTVGAPTNIDRKFRDFSAYRQVSIEMRGVTGQETVDIGLKTHLQPDNGRETKIRVGLTTDWKSYNFSLDRFVGTDISHLYVVTEFVFDGPVAETIEVRRIRYVEQDDTKHPFALESRGSRVLAREGDAQQAATIGYSRLQADTGKSSPAAFSMFSFKVNGVEVSHTAVPASGTVLSGRTYVEIGPSVSTGVAIANPNNVVATISFNFTDSAGVNFGAGVVRIPPNGQMTRFLHETPFSGPFFQGGFSFTSDAGVAVLAVRGTTNQRGEFLMTTLPIVPVVTGPATPVTVPYYADGGGWTTQLILVNPTDTATTGTVQFFSRTGAAATVDIGGQSASIFQYSLPGRTSRTFLTAGQGSNIVSGVVRVVPLTGSTPTPLVVFSFESQGVTVTQTGVPAVQGTALRVLAEATGALNQPGAIHSGVAIGNTTPGEAFVTLELIQQDGAPAGFTKNMTLPAFGASAEFLNEMFPTLVFPFRGMLRITAPTPLSMIGIRGFLNERRELLVSTTPVVSESTAPATDRYFPLLAEGGGYSTLFGLFDGTGQSTSGLIRLYDQNGSGLGLNLK